MLAFERVLLGVRGFLGSVSALLTCWSWLAYLCCVVDLEGCLGCGVKVAVAAQ